MTPRDESWSSQMDHQLRILWRQGMYDKQIAAQMGLTHWQVGLRRRDLGLRAHKYAGHSSEVRNQIRQASIARHKDPVMSAKMLDGLAKGRASPDRQYAPRTIAGNHPSATLTEWDVLAINSLLDDPQRPTIKTIAQAFSVHRDSIANILHGRFWGWLTGRQRKKQEAATPRFRPMRTALVDPIAMNLQI